MQWNTDENAGFTKGVPWISVNKNYKTVNVEYLLTQEQSIFTFYQQLIQLRKNNQAISEGIYQPLLVDDSHVYGYKRISNNEKLVVLCNFFAQSVEIEKRLIDIHAYDISINNYASLESTQTTITLLPYQAVVLQC